MGNSFLHLLLLVSAFPQLVPVAGVVVDATGAVLPGVEVTATSASGRSWLATTSDEGQFEFRLPPGRYAFVAHLTGFREGVLDSVQVDARQGEPLKIVLKTGVPVDDTFLVARIMDMLTVEIDFVPIPEPTVGERIQGRFLIKNTGKAVLQIPTEAMPYDEAQAHNQVMMSVGVGLPEGAHAGTGWLRCVEGTSCTELGPGETMFLTLNGDEGYADAGPTELRLSLRFARIKPRSITQPLVKTVRLDVRN